MSLPWYDLPASCQALDEFWLLLKDELTQQRWDRLPDRLDRTTPLTEQWAHPELLLSQCCGLDLFTPAGRSLLPVARPVFSDLDCEPGSYFSHIVAASRHKRKPERIVINSRSSRSGCTALLQWMARRDWQPEEIIVSGSHEESLGLLRSGGADIAAIDARSWMLLDQRGLVITGRSAVAPSPPFVCFRDDSIPTGGILAALENAVARGGELIGVSSVLPADVATYASLADEAPGAF